MEPIADTGEILEIEKPKHIVIRWRNEFRPELKAEGYSTCRIELEQADGAVRLTIRHEIDKPGAKLIEAVSGGWPKVLSSLKSLLETGAPLPDISGHGKPKQLTLRVRAVASATKSKTETQRVKKSLSYRSTSLHVISGRLEKRHITYSEARVSCGYPFHCSPSAALAAPALRWRRCVSKRLHRGPWREPARWRTNPPADSVTSLRFAGARAGRTSCPTPTRCRRTTRRPLAVAARCPPWWARSSWPSGARRPPASSRNASSNATKGFLPTGNDEKTFLAVDGVHPAGQRRENRARQS